MKTDKWLDWLTNRRYGGNRELAERTLEFFGPLRDKILDRAKIQEGAALLDVGTGDGLIAIGALQRVGPTGEVIFSDISEPSLDYCRAFVESLTESTPRTRFVVAKASDLSEIADASVDIVTLRSVLIYEAEKRKSFLEFYRVLRPGGCVSLFEPVAQLYTRYSPKNQYMGYDLSPISELGKKLFPPKDENVAAGPPDPMADFSDRDFIEFAEDAGFVGLDLETAIQIGPEGMFKGKWDALYRSSPNPNAQTLEERVQERLTAEEAERFVSFLRPLVERGEGRSCRAWCYFTAWKTE